MLLLDSDVIVLGVISPIFDAFKGSNESALFAMGENNSPWYTQATSTRKRWPARVSIRIFLVSELLFFKFRKSYSYWNSSARSLPGGINSNRRYLVCICQWINKNKNSITLLFVYFNNIFEACTLEFVSCRQLLYRFLKRFFHSKQIQLLASIIVQGRGFNSGVVLVNLNRIRKTNWNLMWKSETEERLKEFGKVQLADQVCNQYTVPC